MQKVSQKLRNTSFRKVLKMSSANIQGLSGYQMQLQSVISKTHMLMSNGDNNSMAFAAALRQQASAVQAQISTVSHSNDNNLLEYRKQENAEEKYIYDQKGMKQEMYSSDNMTSTFEVSI